MIPKIQWMGGGSRLLGLFPNINRFSYVMASLRNCLEICPWESLITLGTSLGQIFQDIPFKHFTVSPKHLQDEKITSIFRQDIDRNLTCTY